MYGLYFICTAASLRRIELLGNLVDVMKLIVHNLVTIHYASAIFVCYVECSWQAWCMCTVATLHPGGGHTIVMPFFFVFVSLVHLIQMSEFMVTSHHIN